MLGIFFLNSLKLANCHVNTRMRIKRGIGKGHLCTRQEGGEGGLLLGILGACDARFFKSLLYFRPKHAIFHTFIRSRASLENHTRFQTIMVKIYIHFQTKTTQKAYSLERHIPI